MNVLPNCRMELEKSLHPTSPCLFREKIILKSEINNVFTTSTLVNNKKNTDLQQLTNLPTYSDRPVEYRQPTRLDNSRLFYSHLSIWSINNILLKSVPKFLNYFVHKHKGCHITSPVEVKYYYCKTLNSD